MLSKGLESIYFLNICFPHFQNSRLLHSPPFSPPLPRPNPLRRVLSYIFFLLNILPKLLLCYLNQMELKGQGKGKEGGGNWWQKTVEPLDLC